MASANQTPGQAPGQAQPPSQRLMWGLLGLIALSTPMALAVESGMRRLMMPPDFDQLRAWLSPTLTPWAWATVPLTLAATGLGWWLLRVLVKRELKVTRRGLTPEQARRKADFEALMLASSAPQVPAVAATMLYMLGASLTPVVVSMVLATLGVLSLGLWVRTTAGATGVDELRPGEGDRQDHGSDAGPAASNAPAHTTSQP